MVVAPQWTAGAAILVGRHYSLGGASIGTVPITAPQELPFDIRPYRLGFRKSGALGRDFSLIERTSLAHLPTRERRNSAFTPTCYKGSPGDSLDCPFLWRTARGKRAAWLANWCGDERVIRNDLLHWRRANNSAGRDRLREQADAQVARPESA